MATIDFTFYLGTQLINDYRRYALYREKDGEKLFQKNESQIIYQLSLYQTNLKHFTLVTVLSYNIYD